VANRRRPISDTPPRRGPGRFLFDSFSETVLNAVFIVLGFIGWCIRWTGAAVIFLLVVAASGYYVYSEALEGGDAVTVPNIVELPITDASSILAELGLEMGKQLQVPHDVVPKYHIISQRPQAGEVVRTGRRVIPTVSLGADSEVAPNLLRKSRKEAEHDIKLARFRLGNVSRMPDNAPRDTVLAQDPPPNEYVPQQSAISLLVSAGNARQGAFMPDIQDRPVTELARMLAPFQVYLIPNRVDIANAATDVVLSQDPAPDTLVQPGQVVTYDVKPSGNITLPSDAHDAEVRHQMMEDFFGNEVRIDVVDRLGNRDTKQTYSPSFDETAKQTRVAGSTLKIRVPYVGEATVEVYVDGRLAASYFVKEGGDPVTENY
jgi:serine/threonine-protein kinase